MPSDNPRPIATPAFTVPQEFQGTHRLSPHTDDAFFFARYLSQLDWMRDVLEVSGFQSCRHVVDVGAHVGGWTWPLSSWCEQVTALDIDPVAVDLGARFARQHGLQNVRFLLNTPEHLASLPLADGMLCLMLFQILPPGGVHRVFSLAHRLLRPRGLLLCNSATPWLVLKWLLTGARLRADGWRYQAVWARDVLRGLLMRQVRPERAYYCLKPSALIHLAGTAGFRLVRSPADFRKIPAVRAIEDSKSGRSPLGFRHYHWYLFERGL